MFYMDFTRAGDAPLSRKERCEPVRFWGFSGYLLLPGFCAVALLQFSFTYLAQSFAWFPFLLNVSIGKSILSASTWFQVGVENKKQRNPKKHWKNKKIKKKQKNQKN